MPNDMVKLLLSNTSMNLLRDGRDTLNLSDLSLHIHGAAAFQYLNAGASLGVFERLHNGSGGTLDDLEQATGIDQQSLRCLLFGLKALGYILTKEGRYYNCFLVETLFSNGEWDMVKKLISLQAKIVYLGQADFVESLKESNNVGLRHTPGEGDTLYERLSQKPELQHVFYEYMGAWSQFANPHLLAHAGFGDVKHVIDVGGGDGANAVAIAQQHPHVKVTLLDIPDVEPVANRVIQQADLASHIDFKYCDIFTDPFPTGADCILFAHQLVIWSLEQVEFLLKKAYESLTPGGRVVIFSSISNNDLSGPLFAALDSVYFVSVAAGKGMIYSFNDYEELLKKCGFSDMQSTRCDGWTPHGVVVGIK